MIQQLELEVAQLIAKADKPMAHRCKRVLSIPEEITRRQERKAALEQARAEIEPAPGRATPLNWPSMKRVGRASRQKRTRQKVGGKPPQAPTPEPEPGDQYNFTDPESRINEAGNGNHFEQSYNAQAAVEVRSRLIVAPRLSDAPNDKEQLTPDVQAIPRQAGSVSTVLADSGFYSEKAVNQIERTGSREPSGTVVYTAMDKTGHHRSVADLERNRSRSRRLRARAGRSDALSGEDPIGQSTLQVEAADR